MPEAETFLIFTEPLDRLGLAYMATGSVACMVYGEPRLTHDIDLVLELDASRVDDLCQAFPLESFYCPPPEVMRVEARRMGRGHFNFIHHETGYKADIYLKGADPLHAWAMQRRRRMELPEGKGIWFAPPEYVILRKLEFYREGGSPKHISDIQGILASEETKLDLEALRYWAEATGTKAAWEKLVSGT